MKHSFPIFETRIKSNIAKKREEKNKNEKRNEILKNIIET